MILQITNAAQQTQTFLVLLVIFLAVFIRPRKASGVFPLAATNQLKGLAILSIILAHVGFYLVNDTGFLLPWSQFAGIGVNLFLFLSGYGLTVSSLKNKVSIKAFYAKRLLKIFIPLWVTLIIYILLDTFIVHKAYPTKEIVEAFFGIYPAADLYGNINSPLWYMTPILFYYILFPIVFIRRFPVISALILYAISYRIVYFVTLPITYGVLGLYQLHLWAFPLGITAAWLIFEWEKYAANRNFSLAKVFNTYSKPIEYIARFILAVVFGYILWYFAVHANIGQGPKAEQQASIYAMFGLIGLVLVLPFDSKFLGWMGDYSYELYLLHWPLLYRYGVLFLILPVGVGLFVYLFVFIALGYLLRRTADKCAAIFSHQPKKV